jgi:hypothetical protein
LRRQIAGAFASCRPIGSQQKICTFSCDFVLCISGLGTPKAVKQITRAAVTADARHKAGPMRGAAPTVLATGSMDDAWTLLIRLHRVQFPNCEKIQRWRRKFRCISASIRYRQNTELPLDRMVEPGRTKMDRAQMVDPDGDRPGAGLDGGHSGEVEKPASMASRHATAKKA